MSLASGSLSAESFAESGAEREGHASDPRKSDGVSGLWQSQERRRRRSRLRLFILLAVLFSSFVVLGIRMISLVDGQSARDRTSLNAAGLPRAEIHDRNGNRLAINLKVASMAARPREMIDPEETARSLKRIFPDLDDNWLHRNLTGQRKFVWLRRQMSPEQHQAVRNLGEPGLEFGERYIRLYPAGSLAAHVLGGVRFGEEGLTGADLVGVAGVEGYFDTMLGDPERNGKPLVLSIDSAIQSTTRLILERGMQVVGATIASAILMDVRSGEVIAMVSLPDFDPNDRRSLAETKPEDPARSPLFNHAVQGIYELGSTQKLLTAAMALEHGPYSPETMINVTSPLYTQGFRITDYRYYGPEMSLRDVIVKSSNIGVARIALALGPQIQRGFLSRAGFFEPVPIELAEASGARPIVPGEWRESTTVTVSYGHGLSVSPLHLAAAYAAMVNGGVRVRPTLLKGGDLGSGPDGKKRSQSAERLVSARTSATLRDFLRGVVEDGTATIARGNPYQIGGKTGTADKVNPSGGYFKDRVVASFASVFPASNPTHVLVVIVDDPEIDIQGEAKRTAGWTAVPIAAEVVLRTAPLIGLRPVLAPEGGVPDGILRAVAPE